MILKFKEITESQLSNIIIKTLQLNTKRMA